MIKRACRQMLMWPLVKPGKKHAVICSALIFYGTMVEPTLGSLAEDLLLLQVMCDAPLDEYGLLRQPKWGHLKDVHKAIQLCEAAMVATDPTISSLGQNIEGVEQATVAMPKFLWRSLSNLHLGRTQLIF